MSKVLSLAEQRKNNASDTIMAKAALRAILTNYAKNQNFHPWASVRRLMVQHNFKHVKILSLNLEVYFQNGLLTFDIINRNTLSIDDNCPYCGERYYENATILYIYPSTLHERRVYGCKCGRYYTITHEREEGDK